MDIFFSIQSLIWVFPINKHFKYFIKKKGDPEILGMKFLLVSDLEVEKMVYIVVKLYYSSHKAAEVEEKFQKMNK